MRKLIAAIFYAACMANCHLTFAEVLPINKVIYGDDSRQEANRKAPHLNVAHAVRATGLLTYKKKLYSDGSPHSKLLKTKTYQDEQSLCEGERFANQPVGGFCSGFLVGPETFVTAGHCIESNRDCKELAIIFGFNYKEHTRRSITTIPQDAIYYCKSIAIHRLEKESKIDFAILKLDRAVQDRTPLILSDASVSTKDLLTLIGHPAGIPLKLATGQLIEEPYDSNILISNHDSFAGNSGSPVLNDNGKVIGILIEGDTDYELKGNCYVEKRCDESTCSGEEILSSRIFAEFIHL